VQAKVTYVRDDDAEYDVEYENGTVYTIKAGLEKTRVFYFKKTSPVGFFWVFMFFLGFLGFLGFFGVFLPRREFLGVFQFQEYF
jgi:hypothetical protein